MSSDVTTREKTQPVPAPPVKRVRNPSAADEPTIAVASVSEPEAVGEPTAAPMVSEPVVETPRPIASPARRARWIRPGVALLSLVLVGFSAVVVDRSAAFREVPPAPLPAGKAVASVPADEPTATAAPTPALPADTSAPRPIATALPASPRKVLPAAQPTGSVARDAPHTVATPTSAAAPVPPPPHHDQLLDLMP